MPDIQIEQRNGPYLLPFLDPRPEHLGREDEQPAEDQHEDDPHNGIAAFDEGAPVGHGGQGKRVPDGVLLFNPDLPPVQDGEDQGDETIGGDKREDTVGEGFGNQADAVLQAAYSPVGQPPHGRGDGDPHPHADQHDLEHEPVGLVILRPHHARLGFPVSARQVGGLPEVLQNTRDLGFLRGPAQHIVDEGTQLEFYILPLVFGQAAHHVIYIAVDQGARTGCSRHGVSSSNRRSSSAAICLHWARSCSYTASPYGVRR